MSTDRAVRIAVAFARQAAGVAPAQLCATCAEVLEVSGTSLAVMTGTNTGAVCSSNELTSQLDDLQFVLGEGPTHDAFTSGVAVDEPDLSQGLPGRWPTFSAPALELGARAVFAVPLDIGSTRIGVMTLYSDASGALSQEQALDTRVVADVMAQTMLVLPPGRPIGRLGDAGGHRAEVHQASGIVSVQLGIAVAEALARIRAHAYSSGSAISSVAADIVARRLRLGDDRDKAAGVCSDG